MSLPANRDQQGAALLIALIILMTAMAAALMTQLSSAAADARKEELTTQALAQAKEALIGYAASVVTATAGTSPGPCALNCPRPGELRCPDDNSLGPGFSAANCGGNMIGRFPWKTLNMPDLRDGYGERLIYAVSQNFRRSPRILPLNSDTFGNITVRGSNGAIVNQGNTATGAVAVIIAPGPPIRRLDGTQQNRVPPANYLNWQHYLDCYGTAGCNIEDNANFANNSNNGFIMGPIRDSSGNTIVNDRVMVITREELMRVVEKRIAAEVKAALIAYFAANGYFPRPADFNNFNCLGNGAMPPACNSSASANFGRIPAYAAASWVTSSTSILRPIDLNNWFQQNGWREVVYYGVAPACIDGTSACNGPSVFLTLNHPPAAPTPNVKAVVIMAGPALSTTFPTPQARATIPNKLNLINYMEDENLTPLDNVFTQKVTPPIPPSTTVPPFNDYAIPVP